MSADPVTAAPASPRPPRGEGQRSADLTVEIIDGRLVIAIGVEKLAVAIEGGPAGSEWDATVVDVDQFAREMREQLLIEQEDGTTLVHTMFDTAAGAAIEDGAEGIRLSGEEPTP